MASRHSAVPDVIHPQKQILNVSGISGNGKEGTSTEVKYASSKDWDWHNIHGQNIFVEVDLSDVDSPKYTEYEIPKHKENAQFWGPSKLQGNRVIYIVLQKRYFPHHQTV